jgi:hypothetical protein
MNRPKPITVGFLVAFIVFFLCLSGCLVRTAILPETFGATVLLRPKAPGATPDHLIAGMELIGSDPVLDDAAAQLNLPKVWGDRYFGRRLTPSETRTLLKQRLGGLPDPDRMTITIACFSQEPAEAARVANSVARAFCAVPASKPKGVEWEILNPATPNMKPVGPRIFSELVKGTLIGSAIAALIGSLAAYIVWSRYWSKGETPAAG